MKSMLLISVSTRTRLRKLVSINLIIRMTSLCIKVKAAATCTDSTISAMASLATTMTTATVAAVVTSFRSSLSDVSHSQRTISAQDSLSQPTDPQFRPNCRQLSLQSKTCTISKTGYTMWSHTATMQLLTKTMVFADHTETRSFVTASNATTVTAANLVAAVSSPPRRKTFAFHL